MTAQQSHLTHFENRPFFEQALCYGVQHGIVTVEKIDSIAKEAPKGMVQIANTFGSSYLRAELELARTRMVNLVSLYLSETAHGELEAAARLIRDHTLLTLSRGGSTLLKELFALPEYPILGPTLGSRVEDFLEFWSLKKSNVDYQQAHQQRLQYQNEIQIATELSHWLNLPNSVFQEQHCEAEMLIRSALLIAMHNATKKKQQKPLHCFDQIEFASLLDKIRKHGLKKIEIGFNIPFSDEAQHIIQQLQQDIVANDIPCIENNTVPLDNLVNQLKNRYFVRDHEMEDTASYDALVSKEWSKHTKGKTDIDSILTLLLCIAAGVTSKVVLSEASAKTLVKKIRKQGFQPELAKQFVQQHAPFEKQEGLLEDWLNFCEQAEPYLLDEYDYDLSGAMRFLHENCYVEKPAVKRHEKR